MNHSLFSFYLFSPFSLSLFSPFALVSPFALEEEEEEEARHKDLTWGGARVR